jgi:hypothetical protein
MLLKLKHITFRSVLGCPMVFTFGTRVLPRSLFHSELKIWKTKKVIKQRSFMFVLSAFIVTAVRIKEACGANEDGLVKMLC